MSFYDQIEPMTELAAAFDPARYRPAPANWRLAITDIERSTEAIERGMHKIVNMIAAACIAAVRNACPGQEIPFSFGGDGATLLIPPERAAAAMAALAGVRASAAAAGLTLRVGALDVGALKALGHEVMVARYAPAPGVVFAMFRGGGVGYLDRVLKGHEPGVPSASVTTAIESADPDLTGLSCRFEPITSRGGCTVSLVIVMRSDDDDYRPVLGKLLEIASENARPVSVEGLIATLGRNWLPNREYVALELGAIEHPTPWRRFKRRLVISAGWLAMQLSLRFGLGIGRHDARAALAEKVRNSDFCKADDGLQMVIDCTPDELARIESYLRELETAGVLVFGLHVSDSALMTCLVDAAGSDWHVHFIDGAGGGYTQAAKVMKGKLAARLGRVAEAATASPRGS